MVLLAATSNIATPQATSFAVFTANTQPQVIVALGETLWVVDDTSVTDTPLSPGCLGVTHMALSPDGAFVAVACLDGKVRVLSSGELTHG